MSHGDVMLYHAVTGNGISLTFASPDVPCRFMEVVGTIYASKSVHLRRPFP